MNKISKKYKNNILYNLNNTYPLKENDIIRIIVFLTNLFLLSVLRFSAESTNKIKCNKFLIGHVLNFFT